ncbi:MAG TPA: hypothetical protein VGK94_01100 [Candidatus Polarisedimenticolia bacterium]|jgi:uncharacterized repeat protein (TIGR01451 family)
MVREYGGWVLSLLLVTAGSTAGRSPLSESGAPQVVVDVTAMKEVVARDEAGRERVELREASATGPGDTLVYRISYTNKGTSPAHDAKVTDPIPAGTVLLPGSWEAPGADFAVSVDGGRSWDSYPVRHTVKHADGSTSLEEVDATAYTHVRWTSRESLAPGTTRSAVFKVKVR